MGGTAGDQTGDDAASESNRGCEASAAELGVRLNPRFISMRMSRIRSLPIYTVQLRPLPPAKTTIIIYKGNLEEAWQEAAAILVRDRLTRSS